MATQPTTSWRSTIRRRLATAAAVMLVWTVALEARLVYLQIIRNDDLSTRADKQQNSTTEAPAKRGELLDRDGRVLAFSVDADSVYAIPAEVGDPARAAAAL